MARKGGVDKGILQRKDRAGWWVRLYLNGRQRWFRCNNKSQARALYQRLKAQEREGKYFERPQPVPFRALALEYEAHVDAHRRRRGDDRARIQRWISAFGDEDARTLTVRHIERVLSELHIEGRKPGTIQRYLTVLKAILNRSKRVGLLKDTPTTLVRPPKVNNVLVRYLTPTQQTTLLEALPERLRPIVLIALQTGLRQGELLRLTWADVDWHIGVLTIHETKSGERRRVPMNSAVQGVLSLLKDANERTAADRLFPHDARYLRRAFQRAVEAAGLSPFRFHDLRHTFAFMPAMRGENDRTIMLLGGWKSPRMLDRYAHLSPAHLWKAVEGLTQTGTVAQTVTTPRPGSSETVQLAEKAGAGNGI